jgi:hypothetical protein
MPHQVVKSTSAGSIGDLARITEALHGIGVNIVAVAGGEGVLKKQEVGVISMLLEPDEGGMMKTITTTLKGLDLGNGRKLVHVQNFPAVHILLEDKPGELERAAKAVKGINILSVITVDKHDSAAHVCLGFSNADVKNARAGLTKEKIRIIDPGG